MHLQQQEIGEEKKQDTVPYLYHFQERFVLVSSLSTSQHTRSLNQQYPLLPFLSNQPPLICVYKFLCTMFSVPMSTSRISTFESIQEISLFLPTLHPHPSFSPLLSLLPPVYLLSAFLHQNGQHACAHHHHPHHHLGHGQAPP